MAKVWCASGYVCSESHGVSSAHWEMMSQKEMDEIDKELEEKKAQEDFWDNLAENW